MNYVAEIIEVAKIVVWLFVGCISFLLVIINLSNIYSAIFLLIMWISLSMLTIQVNKVMKNEGFE